MRLVLALVGALLTTRFLCGEWGSEAPIPLFAAAFLAFSAIAELGWPKPTARPRRATPLLVFAGVAALAAFVVRARVVEAYRVTSASMLPTLAPGDRVAGNKLARAPKRGDVIVFRSAPVASGLPEILVKRVVGLPGDRVVMRGGTPQIDGVAIADCDAGEYFEIVPDDALGFVHGRLRVESIDDARFLVVTGAGAPPAADPYVVQPGEVFVLGDDRVRSVDSRGWNDGRPRGVPLDAIEARVDRFLVGAHRDGTADWGRWLHSVDALQTQLRLEGVDVARAADGVDRCADVRPKTGEPLLKIGSSH